MLAAVTALSSCNLVTVEPLVSEHSENFSKDFQALKVEFKSSVYGYTQAFLHVDPDKENCKMHVGYNKIEIFVASEIDDECVKTAVLEHEREHVRIYQNFTRSYWPKTIKVDDLYQYIMIFFRLNSRLQDRLDQTTQAQADNICDGKLKQYKEKL
ncbi:MAG: hypothetical protein N2235_10605 [Fischerella sp.]|nr:hypothetical protein [Fischerella sp.]